MLLKLLANPLHRLYIHLPRSKNFDFLGLGCRAPGGAEREVDLFFFAIAFNPCAAQEFLGTDLV